MNELEREALNYDLPSLVQQQDRRRQNVQLFEQCIANEKTASLEEAKVQSALEEKLMLANSRVLKLSADEVKLIVDDIPKLKSTQARRRENIQKLQKAILEEQDALDREATMIQFLETRHVVPK